jgi:hypothetical protein
MKLIMLKNFTWGFTGPWEHGNEPSGSINNRGISWLAEWLLGLEGRFWCIELFNYIWNVMNWFCVRYKTIHYHGLLSFRMYSRIPLSHVHWSERNYDISRRLVLFGDNFGWFHCKAKILELRDFWGFRRSHHSSISHSMFLSWYSAVK